MSNTLEYCDQAAGKDERGSGCMLWVASMPGSKVGLS